MKDKNLILFTEDYPFGDSERSFLKEEFKYLAIYFRQVFVFPMKISSTQKYNTPENIIVKSELSYALNNISFFQKIKGVFSLDLFKEILRIRFNFSKVKLATAKNIGKVVVVDLLKSQIIDDNFILYSFWFNECALGIADYKKYATKIKRYSRTHNFDLYGNKENGYYVPFQSTILSKLNNTFPVSKDGEDYLKNKFDANVQLSLLGVPKPRKKNKRSNDGIIRVVSCSYIVERKRLNLIFEGLNWVCKKNKSIEILWTHIGDGPNKSNLNALITNSSVKNLNVVLLGELNNKDVHLFYENNPVDLFVNTSEKEGTPVSIMEAISYGIPILATAFGGNKEVVSKGAGFLLPINPNPFDFDKIMIEFLNSDIDKLRLDSLNVWNQNYNSDVNYKRFCLQLLN